MQFFFMEGYGTSTSLFEVGYDPRNVKKIFLKRVIIIIIERM